MHHHWDSERRGCQISTDLLTITPFPEYDTEKTSDESKYYVYQITSMLVHYYNITFNAPPALTLGFEKHSDQLDWDENERTKDKSKKKAEEGTLPPPTSAPPQASSCKGTGKAEEGPVPLTKSQAPSPTAKMPPTPAYNPTRLRAVVLHTAPSKFKPGLTCYWIEEDNKGAQILGIRWLTTEERGMGKLASSLVVYIKVKINLHQGLRMGRKFCRTTRYYWNR
ncbi:hypothetical protein L211DRAFT_854367 [Terfezia boudieri ATCC MYA-4762]|uniref:Uncharacterized protein n=1 Tax=Terfezia boudieri ATCC MYA-4762 TaxID=1051890 RepID=A0A3N4L9Q6_9PEZI|nr:hypothetical protein L211DRAFT_854367 [Terfezia boudieri ATCC MYA-4762]